MKSNNAIPILRSIIAPEALALLVETAYGIKVLRLQLIKAFILDTYRVWTSQGLYILRIYPHQRRTLPEINAELDFVSFLHNQDIRVSHPVLQASGDRLLVVDAPEGERYAALFTYAQGQPLGEDMKAFRVYGSTLARIHTLSDTLPQSSARYARDIACLLDRPLACLSRFELRREDWDFLQRVAAVIAPQITALTTEPPYYGYCHGDASSDNAHVDAEGGVTLFDFDFCGPGWRAYDVGAFLSTERSEAAEEALLAGYDSVRRLTNEEKSALPLFKIAQTIWMLGIRASYINEWGDIYFADGFIDHIVGYVRTIFETVKW